MDLSIVIPVFNEAENLPIVYDELAAVLDALNCDWEVLFVDDGSTDGSPEVAQKIQARDSRLRLLRLDRNHGQTAAMDAGFRHARGSVVMTMDADGQNDPADIPLLLEGLKTHDVCIGWRHERQDNLVRRVSSKIANRIRNAISRETVADTGCSLKAFKREVVEKWKLFEGLHRFFPTLAKLEGFTVTEVKVNHRPRTRGTSKYGVLNRAFKSFKDLIVIRWMQWRMLRYRAVEVSAPQASVEHPEPQLSQKD